MQRMCATHCKLELHAQHVRRMADSCSGGLGLTGGIADVGSLFDCLYGIYTGRADDSILDKYAEIRRKIYKEVIDPASRENFRRLYELDPETAKDDEFFKTLKKAETDKDLARELNKVSSRRL